MCENEVTMLRSTEERVAQTLCLSVKRDAPPRLPPTEGPFLKGPYLWRYRTHIHKTGHSVVENYSGVRKRPIVAKKKMLKCVNRSDYSKYVRSQFLRIRLKIAKKCWLYLDIFSCVKINVFRSFFAFRLEMHVRYDNQYKTGADRGIFLDNRGCVHGYLRFEPGA